MNVTHTHTRTHTHTHIHHTHTHTHTHAHTHTHIHHTQSLKSAIGDVWLNYIHEDPQVRDEERWKLIHRGQKRREE